MNNAEKGDLKEFIDEATKINHRVATYHMALSRMVHNICTINPAQKQTVEVGMVVTKSGSFKESK